MTHYYCAVNELIYNQVTAMYFLFTEPVLPEVVLKQITDSCTPVSSHIPTGQLRFGIS
jgi:hypothetical protein